MSEQGTEGYVLLVRFRLEGRESLVCFEMEEIELLLWFKVEETNDGTLVEIA